MRQPSRSPLLDLAAAGLDLILPPRCAACSRITPSLPFCEACWPAVLPCTAACPRCALPESASRCPACRDFPLALAGVRARFLYGGQLAVAIRRSKREEGAHLCQVLGTLLRGELARQGPVDLLLPVPLHSARLRQRGFNQAALLARAAVRGTDLKLSFSALLRHRDTPRQAGLDRIARLGSVRGAFQARSRLVRGKRLLLLDDVMTTGSTLQASAEACLRAGATEVKALVLARAVLVREGRDLLTTPTTMP